MVTEIERAGFTVVHVAPIVPVSQNTGANRIVRAYSIPAPMGNPNEPLEIRKKQRYELMKTALTALSTEITEQTVFN